MLGGLQVKFKTPQVTMRELCMPGDQLNKIQTF